MAELAYMQPPAAAGQPGPSEDETARLREALRAIVDRLQCEANDRVAKRSTVEKRWIDDLRQLTGKYDAKVFKELEAAKKSTLFINQTRSKSNACEARLSDMLFPTDDKNWGIKPTPVPELTSAARDDLQRAKDLAAQATQMLGGGQDPTPASEIVAAQAQAHADIASQATAEMDEARKRAEAMQAEIDDQLTECGYNIQCRDTIRDAARIGTGVMKGPVGATDRVRRSWKKTVVEGGAEIYQLEMTADPRPAYYHVDYWGFFPEPDARTLDESESFFERHMLTKKGLRALAREPGFDREAIRRLLKDEPATSLPTYMSELRGITDENTAPSDGRYQAWEYRGPLTAEDMRLLCTCLARDDIAEKFAGEEIDPLTEIAVVLWFCQGEVLKFGVHHLDSGEAIYSVYNLEKDDASIWGFGIPYIMRNSQKAMNGAWRMMMDNAGLSSGPQIEVDRSVIEPADENWIFTPRKIWFRLPSAPAGKDGIKTYNIESHQGELAAIIQLAKQFVDEETAITILAQGEQGTHTTQTSSGMALLMNAVNVVFRRMVKGFDDDVTVPNIRRLYDWNMQFSPKEHIKGDFEVDARGSSVLLVREIQSQNLMVLLGFTAHPVLGLLLNAAALLRKTAQSMMIPADEVVKTDDEIKRQAEMMKAQPQPQEEDPTAELALKREIAEIDAKSRVEVATINHQTAMMTLAEQRNMTLDELRGKLDLKKVETDSKERIFAGEIAAEARNAAAAAARGKNAAGSGGYVSAP